MLAGLEVPSKGLGAEACAQIRSWREVNLVGAPEGTPATAFPSTASRSSSPCCVVALSGSR